MSNSASQVSPATLLRRVRKDAKEQLEAKSNEVTDLTNRLETTTTQLQNANEVIDRQDDTIADQRGRILNLVGDVDDTAQNLIRLHGEAKACFGVIEAIATEKVSKNDIIVLVTHLATIAPDKLLTAAQAAFKDLLAERKAEREAAEKQQAYNFISKVASVDYQSLISTANSLIVGDKVAVQHLIGSIDPETGAEIMRLLKSGLKIQAIKVVRDATHCSLRDARDAVDSMQNGLKKIAEFRSRLG